MHQDILLLTSLFLSSSAPKLHHFQFYYTIFEITAGNELDFLSTDCGIVLFWVQSKRYFKCFACLFVLEREFSKKEKIVPP